jgi:hypothetical protein
MKKSHTIHVPRRVRSLPWRRQGDGHGHQDQVGADLGFGVRADDAARQKCTPGGELDLDQHAEGRSNDQRHEAHHSSQLRRGQVAITDARRLADQPEDEQDDSQQHQRARHRTKWLVAGPPVE